MITQRMGSVKTAPLFRTRPTVPEIPVADKIPGAVVLPWGHV